MINSGVTAIEKAIMNRIKIEYGVGFLQSHIQKLGINPPGKDYSYTSKIMQNLPLIRLAL